MIEMLFLALLFGIGTLQLTRSLEEHRVTLPPGFAILITVLLLAACFLIVITSAPLPAFSGSHPR